MSDAMDPQLEAALLAAGADMGLQLTSQQVERMMQLHLACEQRTGIIIMGPSGSGKSMIWQVIIWDVGWQGCSAVAVAASCQQRIGVIIKGPSSSGHSPLFASN